MFLFLVVERYLLFLDRTEQKIIFTYNIMAEWRDLVRRLTKKHKGKPLAAILTEARKQYNKSKKNNKSTKKTKRRR